MGKKRGNRREKGHKKASGNNRSALKKQSRTTAGTNVSSTCFETAMTCMKIWKDVVSNFERQRKRMIKQNKTGGNKAGKKGAFAPTATRLVDIGGGNRSNMSCGGQYGNKGAAQLKNLTDTLFDCEVKVNASCNTANIPQPNFTFIDNCKALVDTFTKEATICLKKTVGGKKTTNVDSCSCWSSPTLNQTAAAVKNCKANNASAAITGALKNCTAAFQKCRKFEDAAANAISSCASDSSKLTKKAANLAANKASMTAAKTKMSSLATATGRLARAAASTCAEIVTISQKISKLAITFPQSPKISTYATKISSSTATCTTDEKALLLTEVTAMGTAITSVTTALTAIQEQILTMTGSTASTSQHGRGLLCGSAGHRGARDLGGVGGDLGTLGR